MPERAAALDIAHRAASSWLDSLADRPVPPQATAAEVALRLGADLPDGPSDPAAVVQLLADACTPGLTAMPGGRFFGFVIGGTHPAALAADWLVSAWDQNCGLRGLTPAHTAVEDIATTWLVDLLGLPAGSAIGYVTGATTANVTGLATGRDAVLRRAGWDVPRDGLSGGPRVRVLVGAERHDTIDLALRYLGLGAPEQVAADDQGRLRVDELQRLLETGPEGPTMVLLQAGNVHSGAFDPLAEAIAVAHRHGAWVHVDGAFGLWAAASPRHRHLVAGHEAADSWATDAHKTLNVPYDCGLLACAHPRTCVRPWVSRARTCSSSTRAGSSRPTRCWSCRAADAPSRSGRCSVHSAAPGSPTWSTASVVMRRPSPTVWPTSVPPSATTSCSRRCARTSATTPAPTP